MHLSGSATTHHVARCRMLCSAGCAGEALGACGFQLNHNVSLYSSVDLVAWTFEGTVFQVLNMSLSRGGSHYTTVN